MTDYPAKPWNGIHLGDHVRDLISGFEGIAWMRAEYLDGTRSIGVKANKLSEEGKLMDTAYFCCEHLEVIEEWKVPTGRRAPSGDGK